LHASTYSLLARNLLQSIRIIVSRATICRASSFWQAGVVRL